MPRPSSWWSSLPAFLSIAILALQVAAPWTAGAYVTQDGPSHLYTAVVARDLILHPHGIYAAAYDFQHRLTTNWGTIILFNLLLPVFGAARAEAALASLCVLIAFACVTYFRRSLTPSVASLDPMTNFLVNTWFLSVGYYDFYLGMVLCVMLAGFSIRCAAQPSRRQAAALCAGLTALFFIHIIPAALAIMAVAFVVAWRSLRGPWRDTASLLAATIPAAILLAFFAKGYSRAPLSSPDIESAWDSFPMHVFASARGRAAEEALLVPAMIFVMVAGIIALRRREWASVRLPLAAAALASFAAYLFVPDVGFSGAGSKIRFAWAVFLWGCPVALSGARLRTLRTPLSLYIACFLVAGLATTAILRRNLSPALRAYAGALRDVPEGSTVLRMHYATQAARDRFRFGEIASDPLLHADAWIASQRRFIDLTDYSAPSRVFPIGFRKTFSGEQQQRMYSLEGGESAGLGRLKRVLQDLPADPARHDPIYVVLIGDTGSVETRNSDFTTSTTWLNSNLEPLSEEDFVRVYREH